VLGQLGAGERPVRREDAPGQAVGSSAQVVVQAESVVAAAGFGDDPSSAVNLDGRQVGS
jgi:hypothetical protein